MIKKQSNETSNQRIEDLLAYQFGTSLLTELKRHGQLMRFDADEVVISIGDTMRFMPIVLQGSIKVLRENDKEEDLLLYYIEGGDTCAMTMQCCVRNSKSQVKAVVVEEAELLMVPVEHMEAWMGKFPEWRNYVLNSYHTRMLELLETIDAIAFMRLDERLLKYLKDQAKLMGSLELHATHQQIADDLHSSRVVISRLLKQLEQKGLVKLHRNRIELAGI
jgi:CRP/FNR family transcriptional regulator